MANETPLTQEQICKDWLRFSINDFKKAIRKKGISQARNRLINSIEGIVTAAGGNGLVEKIVIKFFKYGRFVDMGVGRGVPIGSQAKKADFHKHRKTENSATGKRGQLHQYNRRPKKWYSTTWPGKEKDLTTLIYDNYGDQIIQVIESGLTNPPKEISI